MMRKAQYVEYTGNYISFPTILRLVTKYGLHCKYVDPANSNPETLTVFFYDGDDQPLQRLLVRKQADRIVIVSPTDSFPASAGGNIDCYTNTGSDDAYETARCIYVKYYRLKAGQTKTTAYMMRQLFRYAIRLLS